VRDLLVQHYDPIYLQSMRRNFGGFSAPHSRAAWDGGEATLHDVARRMIADA
jgi:tRNA 2-selenouridine synthase